MARNIVFNKSDSTAEIEIYGDIGESWFGEPNTFESVKNSIQSLGDVSDITIRVASLGGDVSHGLAIHDLIKTLPGNKKAIIDGWTASAGTIVALAADEIEIAENAFFLIHNSWTGTVGNAEAHREQAEMLDKVDARLVKIYKSKTGKTENAIRKQMAKEEWMSPEEAIEFGLVDKKTKASKVAASVDIKAINNSKNLPKTTIKMSETTEKNFASEVMAKLDKWGEELKGLFNKAPEAPQVTPEQIAKAQADFQAKVNEITAEVNALKEANAKVENDLNAKGAENEQLKSEIEKLKVAPANSGKSNESPEGGKAKAEGSALGNYLLNRVKPII